MGGSWRKKVLKQKKERAKEKSCTKQDVYTEKENSIIVRMFKIEIELVL